MQHWQRFPAIQPITRILPDAAIAKAVFHAAGKRVRDLPIRIEDVLTG